MINKITCLMIGLFFNTIALAANDMDAFKQSWTAKALKLQREIDLNAPFYAATFLGTHNSENSKAYQISFLRYVDPNQLLSIYDQLELGIRSIEFDIHWTTAKNLSKDILLCHGQWDHTGCSIFDKPVTEGLQELRDWLKANPNEIVILYFDRALDGHEPRLTELLNRYLGEFIFKPVHLSNLTPEPSCVSLPGTLTKADILKAGKQLILVTKNCDGMFPNYQETDQYKLHWNDFVFAGIDVTTRNPFTILDSTMNSFTHFPDCGFSKIFFDDPPHKSMWRIFEDRTILSNLDRPQKKILDEDIKELLQCGINLPTFDMLTIFDSRLTAAIWSWAASYPKEGAGYCAIYKPGEGIENVNCSQIHSYVCHHQTDWQVTLLTGPWKEGEASCQTAFGKDWHFATPINGNQMNSLKNIKSREEVWLNYSEDTTGVWRVN